MIHPVLTFGKWHVTNMKMMIAIIPIVLFLALPLGIDLFKVMKVLININTGNNTIIIPEPIKP